MQITYRYRFDRDYTKVVIRRQYAQVPFALRLPIQFGIIGVLGGALLGWSLEAPLTNRIVAALVMATLLAVGGVLGVRAGLLARFKRSAEFGSEVSLTLSDEGVAVKGTNVETKAAWAAYPKAVRFNDGLLLQRPGAIRWLPDSGLVEGAPVDATNLVASKTALRYVA